MSPFSDHADITFSRPLRFVNYGLAIVATLLLGMILWAAIAPLDKGVSVSGQVMVSSNRKIVQPVFSGRIATINVQDGEQVYQGQILAIMDTATAAAMRDNLSWQQLEALATYHRLLAEQNNQSDIAFPEVLTVAKSASGNLSLSQLRQSQQTLLTSRQRVHQRQITTAGSAINSIKAQIAGSQALIQSYQKQITLLQQQQQKLTPLVRQGYVAAIRLTELEEKLAQLSGSLLQEQHNSVKMRHQITEMEQTLALRDSEYQNEIDNQLVDISHQLQDITQRLKTADYELQHTAIVAPVSGKIVGLSVYTPGMIVSSGQVLMEIVPLDQPLIISAPLPIHLVDKVTPGATVELSFPAFNQIKTPRISGHVTLVGADQLRNPGNDQPYYDLLIQVDEQQTAFTGHFPLRPGMPAEVFIRTGERSFLTYLFKPFFDRLRFAFTEE